MSAATLQSLIPRQVSGTNGCRGRWSHAQHRARAAANRGFTLLEVILALAILAGSMAAVGEVMRLADQTATQTEAETQAQILAASIMDELACGARPLDQVDQEILVGDSDPQWEYSIAVEDSSMDELVAVRVLVQQKLDARLTPPRFELVRWMPNPNYTSSTSASESDATSSSSSSTSNSSSTSSGSSP